MKVVIAIDSFKGCLSSAEANEALLHAGFTRVECINPPEITLEEAMRPDVAKRHIQQTVVRMLGH